MSAVDNIIPEVRALGAYSLKATAARVKLNQNESPLDLPAEAKDAIMSRVAAIPWNRYPDFYPEDVLAGLGQTHGLGAANVMVGNGSNELIQAVFAATVGRGTEVAIPSPTFTLYAMMVAANQGTCTTVPLDASLTYDLGAWRALAKQGNAHLLLCSPNNPTGAIVDDATVDELCRVTPRLVIVDEAYAQFGPTDAAGLVAEHANLIVLRTFSKAVGLAAIRFGYALASAALVTEITKVKLPYNVGIMGLEVAREVLRQPDLLEGPTATIVSERARLEDAVRRLPFDAVYPGHANFVLVRTSRSSELFGFLFERGILVRDVGHYPMLDGCLRFSVGSAEQNDELVTAITAFFDEASP